MQIFIMLYELTVARGKKQLDSSTDLHFYIGQNNKN